MTLSTFISNIAAGMPANFQAEQNLDWDGEQPLEQLFSLIDTVLGDTRAADLFDFHFPADFFPDTGMQLDAVELDPSPVGGAGFHLLIAFSWPEAELEIIPDLISIGDFHVELNFENDSYSFELDGVIQLDGIDFQATIELPSLMFEADLLQLDLGPHLDLSEQGSTQLSSKPSPTALLHRFDAHPLGNSAPSDELELSSFLIFGNPQEERFLMHMGLKNLVLGPISLDFQTRLNWSAGNISGELWADFEIDIPRAGANDIQIAIPVYAAHDGPGEGWELAGGVALSGVDFVDLFGALATKFNTSTPIHPVLDRPGVDLRYVFVSFDTKTRAFSFSCTLDFHNFFGHSVQADAGSEDETELTITIDVQPDSDNPDQNEFTFGGQLIFHLEHPAHEAPVNLPAAGSTVDSPLSLEFDFVFDRAAGSKTLIAAYRNLSGGEINIGRLLDQLNSSETDLDFSVNLQEAFLIFEKPDPAAAGEAEPAPNYLLGGVLGLEASLSSLPLVGRFFAEAGDPRLLITPLYASTDYTAEQLAHYQELVPGDDLALPQEELAEGPKVDVALYLGGDPLHLALSLGTADLRDDGGGSPAPAAGEENASAGNANTVDDTTWFDVGKNFARIFYLGRIGIQYDPTDQQFWFKMDAALTAGPVTLSVLGLGLGVELPDFTPSFQIRGLGLDFKKDGLEIGGAFLRSPTADGVTEEYAGMALIKWKQLSISAIGAYADYEGQPSMFIYAVLNYPIGGPSFFFVTGLALGFGINRRVNMPSSSEKIAEFPLVQQAVNPGGSPDDLSVVMDGIKTALPPHLGEHFIAVGIKFTSFELIDSFLLLTVTFGVHLEFRLLGLSTLEVPRSLDSDPKVTIKDGDTTTTKKPELLALVRMGVDVSYLPEEGLLDAHADILKGSYVLSPDCRLSGGFAFRAWFKDSTTTAAKAGEFVMTLGGYHPKFKAPTHYPQPARLAFDWQVTDDLLIHGEAYYALTAHLLMAGGYLSATYDSSLFKAHFAVGANFLISWKPFHYEADAFIEIGVETALGDFSVGAKVEIWGPDFSGTAEIETSIKTFHVNFGNERGEADPISWPSFHDTFLPSDPDKVCHIAVTDGLVRKIESPELYRVSAEQFSLEVRSAIPASQVNFLANSAGTDPRLGIGPMGLATLTSSLSVTAITDPNGNPVTGAFTTAIIAEQVPAALWGGTLKPALNGERYIDQAQRGLRLQSKPWAPAPGDALFPQSLEVERTQLDYNTFPLLDALAVGELIHFVPVSGRAMDIDSTTARAARNTTLTALGFQPDEMDLHIDADLADAFTFQPLVGEH